MDEVTSGASADRAAEESAIPYREAVTLADLEEMNQADAAERAGVSVSGIKSRIQRGRRQLKAVLEECCRVDLDRRGAIVGYEPRHPDSCKCGSCG